MFTRQTILARLAVAAVLVALAAGPVMADDWDIYMTVDNQFDVYFGTPTATNFAAGGGTNWAVEYFFQAFGRLPSDYLYVATASDHGGLQGFIGTFKNVTTNTTISTGNAVWEVFPAGAFAATNPYWPNPWPYLQMPTQSQVDTAIAYATVNNLWVTPTGAAGYDNDPTTPITPYSSQWGVYFPNVQASADWIWYDSGNDAGNPFSAVPLSGFNHDEFLVFRIAGVPTPEPGTATLVLLGLAATSMMARRRHA